MKWPFSRKPKAPPAPIPSPIHVAGIYTICSRLHLPKTGWPEHRGRKMQVAMESGKIAIYELTDFKYNLGVDWDWFIFTFVRYLESEERSLLPAYNFVEGRAGA